MPISRTPGPPGAGNKLTEYPEADVPAEASFRALLEDQTEVISRFRADGTYTYVNEIYCRFFGKTAAELVGRRWQPVAYPEDVQHIQAQLAVLSPVQPVVEIENRVYSGTGELCWMQFVNRAFFDASGALTEIQSVGRDITARKQAESALLESEEKYRRLFDSLTQGVFLQRADGALVDVNPAALALFGLERDEFLGRTSLNPEWHVIGEDGSPLSAEKHPSMLALRSGRVVSDQVLGVFNPRRGEYVWLVVNAIPQFRPGETRPHHVFVSMHDITARRLTEQALRRSEAHFRIYYELGLIGMAITSPGKGWVQFNDRLCAILGYSRGELARKTWSEVTHPDDLAADEAQFSRIAAGEVEGYALDKRFIRKDGRVVYAAISIRCVRKSDGSVDHFVAMVQDITERQMAEDTLRESEMRYRGLVESAPDAILVIKRNRVVLVNPACLSLFGAKRPEDLLGRTSFDLLHPDCHALILARIHRVLDGDVARPAVEEKIIRLDGKAVDVEVSAAPIDYAGGGAMHVVLRDITARKARDAELQRMIRTERAIGHINQALLHATDESELLNEVCRIVVEDCGHAMMWIGMAEQDPDRSVRPVAHAGFESGYLDCLNITWADSERGQGPTGTAIRTGQPSFCRDMAVDTRFSLWRAEALQRGYASSAAFPLQDARGGVFGVMSLYSREIDPFTPDETNLLSALAGDLAFGIRTLRLRAAHAETEAAMSALRNEFQQLLEWQVASQTAAAIAHEIGQPLNAVTTFGEAALLLLDSFSPRPEKLARAVEGMAAQAERAGHVVRELMQFLRQTEVTLEDLDLNELAQRAVAMARAGFRGLGRINVIARPDLPAVRGNRLQIEKVLLNLLGNGADAMREAGLKGRDAGMTLRLSVDGDKARVSVSDMGPGLEPALAQRIFEPFFTTKTKGIGMGLAISRALVEAQGGKLWYEPHSGAGATFHFTIPLAP